MLRTRSQHVFARCLIAVSLVLAGLTPAFAHAQVQASDRVDGRSAKEMGIPKAAMPDVRMAAGALVTEDGRVLWSRSVSDRRAIASITKLMTAVVALENGELDDPVTVTAASQTVGESTSFLRVGEQLPLSEVLEASLVKSGNDAAVALAIHIAGSEDAFVDLMNAKAQELGLSRTRFANPHGLDETGHYSTAADVAVLSRYAMSKPEVRRVVSQKTATIGRGSRSEKVVNTNLLIGNYTGANGVKTGWTSKAGYCVVNSARRGEIELYAIVLGTTNETQRFRDAVELFDFGFAHYRPQRVSTKDTIVAEAPVRDYLDRLVPVAMSADSTVAVFDLAGTITRKVTVSAVDAPVAKGQKIGVATFTQADRVIASVPLVAAEEVKKPSVPARVFIAAARAWRWLTGG